MIAFDLLRTFYHSFQRRTEGSNNFLKMSVFVMLLSSFIVGLSLLLEHTNVFQVGYGMLGNVCWIKSNNARLYLFLLPSYIILFITIVSLVVVLVSIKRDMEPSVSVRRNVSLPVMALKLTLAFGLPEVIGILQPGRETESLALVDHVATMLHSVVRSARGIVMFVIFFLTKNVLGHVKSRFR